jgi:ligand-binding sensor domain-containing protein
MLAVLAAAGFAERAFWRAQRVLTSSARQVSSANEFAFRVEQLGGVRREARFHRVVSSGGFHSAVAFSGGLFVCGRSSLTRYGSDGSAQQTWYVGEDLPPSPLTALAVRRGVGTPELWIGTDGAGVLIYDGQQLTQGLPSEPGQRKISAISPLGNGQVLLGTPNNGLYITDGKHLRLIHNQFAHTEVTALAGEQDEIWVGTRGDGVWMWRAGEATQFKTELPDAQVLSLYSEGGETWAGTPLGVAEFASGQFRRPLAEGVFAQCLLAHAGLLFIGTVDEGVITLPLNARTVHANFLAGESRAIFMGGSVKALADVGSDLLAVAGSNVVRLPSAEPVISPSDATLTDEHISALLADSRGRLWVGHFDDGLDLVGQGSSQRVRHMEGDLVFCVNRIKEDTRQARIAVGTANGIAIFDAAGELRETFTAKNGLASSHVSDLLFQKDDSGSGSSLVMATSAGITFVERGSLSSLSTFQGLVSNHVYTLAARNGTLLAGTLGGFSLLQNGSVAASFTTANSALRQNWITASTVAGNDIYLGTYGSGVIRIGRDSSLTSFKEFAKERIEINPNAMLATDRAIYAGTAGQGLAVLRAGEERWHFIRVGLPSLNVTAVALRNGTLYVGTDNGLVSAMEREIV